MAKFLARFGSVMLALFAIVLFAGKARSGMEKSRASNPRAVAAPAATETLTYDHVHMGVPDQAKGVEWYAKYMGGQPGPAGEPNERLLFGKTRLIFQKNDDPKPSAGSAVDHIGFSFRDVDAKMKELEAAGVKIVTPVREVPGQKLKIGFVEDPWGTKIEIVQDPDTLGFHHVHLRAPDPEAAFKWYIEMFGGERTKWKGFDALKYGDVWILAQKGDAVPSAGHSIDHIGFRTTMDVDAKAVELKGKGVKYITEPYNVRDIRVSFVEGPATVKIELLKR